MKKIKLYIQNCYGISKLEHEIEFSRNNYSSVIYAPNGVMKTSLAKAVSDYVKQKEAKDEVFPEKESKFIINDENNTPIERESLFVIDSINEKYSSDKISTLLVSEKLRKEYQEISSEIDKKKIKLLQKLKHKLKIRDTSAVEEAFISDYGVPSSEFLPRLARLERDVKSGRYMSFKEYEYKTLFNEKVESLLSENKIKERLTSYAKIYERLIDNSRFFKKGVFNHSNAEVIAKNLDSNGWFDGGHYVTMNDGSNDLKIKSHQELVDAIEKEKQFILNDSSLKTMFAGMDNQFKNTDLKKFRDYLLRNPALIPELENIDYLRDKIWIAYLTEFQEDYFDLIKTYDENVERIREILEKADSQQTRWQQVIDLFNERFSVPFEVTIANKRDAVLSRESPQIVFYFKNEQGEPVKKIQKDSLNSILSNGEKRALYILNIIFEIEARKQKKIKTLFLIDDIADSFDYKNKYAIIEYLSEIQESTNPDFYMIIMSHNYDFYRTVKNRLRINEINCFYSIKSNEDIILEKDSIKNNPFSEWKENLDNIEYLIASIPFVRNLSDYLGESYIYEKLTTLLHIKQDSSQINFQDLKDMYIKILSKELLEKMKSNNESVIDKIFELCDLIAQEQQESVQLCKKIILSIGIRLELEKILRNNIDWNGTTKKDFSRNQTVELIKKYKNQPRPNKNILKLARRVQLMTPENIHLNSFMYEPILDLSMHHLSQLYKDLKAVN